MRKIFKGLAALAICGAISFGLTNEAQATELDSSNTFGNTEVQELYGPPPPPHHRHRPPPPPPPHHRHGPPPPPHWDDGYGPPPPPPHHRHGPPPPPPRHGW